MVVSWRPLEGESLEGSSGKLYRVVDEVAWSVSLPPVIPKNKGKQSNGGILSVSRERDRE